MLKKVLIFLLFLFWVAVPACLATSPAISLQNPLPSFELATPQDPLKLSYLGLDANKPGFSIGDIKAEIVIIEIFSMYCPFCQLEAPKVNTLFSLITKDQELSKRVKMIGIGVGNSDYEVDYFRKSYQVDFPLFSDEDFTIHKACGEVRTPFFVGVKGDSSGQPIVVFTQLGSFESPENFLEEILKSGGIKGGK